MSAPLAWIILPGIAGGVLLLLRGRQRATVIIGISLALILAALVFWIPINEVVNLRGWSFKLSDSLEFFGRRLVLENDDRPVLALSYLLTAFWFCAAYTARTSRIFVPLGLGLISLLTAALAVQPFLYAALLIEMAVCVCIPLLSPPGKLLGRGVLRFFTFQTLGMPFILFTGWMLAGVEASPGDVFLITRAGILLGFGFAFLIGIFPFHTWLPMLSEETHPYSTNFVFFISFWMVSLFGLGFLDRYAWLRESSAVQEQIRLSGVLMVLAGGIWASFQRHLGRMVGYAVMTEIGYSLLAVSLPGGIAIYFMMLLPRVLAFAIWTLALSLLQNMGGSEHSLNLGFESVQGLARKAPLVGASLILAHFSVAGLPLLAGFPTRLILWSDLVSEQTPIAILSLVGSMGLLLGGLRTLGVLIHSPEPAEWQVTEKPVTWIFLGIGMILLILVGIMPGWFLAPLANLASVFEHLAP